MDIPLIDLISHPEGKRLEFKRDLSAKDNILKTLVAFSNAAGGKLVIGVTDDREIIGIANPLDEEERIGNLIADTIAPRLVPNIELATIDTKTILAVEVFPSACRPHHINRLGPERGVYVRLGSSNRLAGPDVIAELKRSSRGIVFDEQPMVDLSPQDLDLKALEQHFGADRQLDDQSLVTLRLLRKEQNRLVPTIGAVLLFGKDRQQHFPDAWVQCGRFRGKDKIDIFDQTEIHDHLPDTVTSIELFLQKHAFKTARFGEMRREDVWSIPIPILREAIVNALVHCDYSQRGSPIRVAYFDDRIDIESPGALMPGMTIEDMRTGISRIRNPVIARLFRELGLIEQWGSGIKRIYDEASKLGLPDPEITETATGLRLRIFLSQLFTLRNRTATGLTIKEPGNHLPRLESRLESRLAARVLLQLRDCANGKIALARALGHQRVSGELNKQVRHLLALGLIVMTIPDKPNSRSQKYQLTSAGRELMDTL